MNTEREYHDELEQLLREQLQPFAPEAPERLWSGIEARLPQQKRRALIWWWVLALGILISLGVWMYFQQGKTELRTSPEQQNNVAVAKLPLQPALPAVVPESGQKDKPFYSLAPAESNAAARKNQPAANTFISDKTKNKNDFHVENEALASILPQRVAPAAFPVFEELNVVVPQELPLVSHAFPDFPSVSIPVKSTVARRFTLGFQLAPLWVFQKHNVAQPHHTPVAPAFSEVVETPATGWQTGLSMAYEIVPHWRLESGLGLRQETFNSAHSATLRLMDGTCLNPYDSGAKHYEFQYALASGRNSSDVTVRISQVDSTVSMPLDEPFSLDMRTTRHTSSLNLPLSLSRSFGSGRWQGYVRGGITLNYVVQTAVQVQHFSEACVDLCFSTGLLPSISVTPQHLFSVQYQFGGGVEYLLSPRLGVRLEPALFGQKGQSGLLLNSGVDIKF